MFQSLEILPFLVRLVRVGAMASKTGYSQIGELKKQDPVNLCFFASDHSPFRCIPSLYSALWAFYESKSFKGYL